ncbi:phytanoyl-CoA dioxygenase family protein [Porticoccus sp. GXU_MW_L64]
MSILNQSQISEYKNNGVVFLPGLISSEWVERMLAVVKHQMNKPSNWANDSGRDGGEGRMFTDRYQWQKNPEINAYIHETPLAQAAAEAMESASARFYFDHILVKQPNTPNSTPWHQDAPYWPFDGKQICSIWVALTETTVEQSALEFVRGSHATNKVFAPTSFNTSENNPNSKWQESGDGEETPDIEKNRSAFDIVSWNVKPGDALLFSAWTLHGAQGNQSNTHMRAAISTRWLGDDAIWQPSPGTDPTVQQKDVSVEPGQLAHDDKVFPKIWPRYSANGSMDYA